MGGRAKVRPIHYPVQKDPQKPWVQIRIGSSLSLYGGLAALYGDESPSFTAAISRSSLPPGLVQPHEDYISTLDISGRSFTVLVCRKPELNAGLWNVKPESVTKNAWVMRDEFLRLEPDPLSGWNWSARQFLDKWGLWGTGQVYVDRLEMPSPARTEAFLNSVKGERIFNLGKHGFLFVMPHLLKEQQESYRKALLPRNSHAWLRSHPLSLDTADEFPFFRVRKSYCTDAIEATITIDHLAERQFGICKRCHSVFEKETRHKKNYCSERCINAAGVKRWRENQRKAAGKKGKRNAKG